MGLRSYLILFIRFTRVCDRLSACRARELIRSLGRVVSSRRNYPNDPNVGFVSQLVSSAQWLRSRISLLRDRECVNIRRRVQLSLLLPQFRENKIMWCRVEEPCVAALAERECAVFGQPAGACRIADIYSNTSGLIGGGKPFKGSTYNAQKRKERKIPKHVVVDRSTSAKRQDT